MLDQPDHEETSDPPPDQLHGHYPPQYDQQNPPISDYYQGSMTAPPQLQPHPANTDGPGGQFGNMGEMIDPNDPMLDADPFGLSASMHYPTSYSFEQPQR